MFIYYLLLLILAGVYLIANQVFVKTTFGGAYSEEAKRRFRNRYVMLAAFILLALMMGLRDITVGIDLVRYKYRYDHFELMLGWDSYVSEQGFNIFNAVLAQGGVPWQLYLGIVGVIISFPMMYFLYKHSDDMLLSFFLFITIGVFSFLMSAIRQSIAMAIGVAVFELIRKKKVILPLLLIALAYSFHNSAIIMLAYFPVCYFRPNRLLSGVTLFICSLCIVYRKYLTGLIEILSPQKYDDMSLTENYQINPLLIVIAILIPLFCYLFNKEIGKKDSIDTVFFSMSCLNIFFVILSISNGLVGRLANYFAIANAALIPNTIYKLDNKGKVIVVPLLIFIGVVYFYLGSVDGTYQIDNFRFFWEVI